MFARFERVNFCLFLLLTILLAGLMLCVNGVATEVLLSFGAIPVLASGIVICLIDGLFTYWVLNSVLQEFEYNSKPSKNWPKNLVICFSILVTIIVFYAPGETLIKGHNRAKSLRTIAPLVQQMAGDVFDDIDTNKDGILTESELKNHINQIPATSDIHTALVHTYNDIEGVGHIIGSFISTSAILYTYGVSRKDLQTYPTRVTQRWKNW